MNAKMPGFKYGLRVLLTAALAVFNSVLEGKETSALSEIPTVVCAPMVKSLWDQREVVGDTMAMEKCFNLYTPNNSPCGCSATVMAQLMHYWRYPVSAVASRKVECSYNGNAVTLTLAGGIYNWDLMPDDTTGATAAQREALGRLAYDCGVSIGTFYGDAVSLAYTEDAANAFKEVFGYKSAVALQGYDEKKLISNLNAGRPVLLGLMASSGDGGKGSGAGHEAIADGYGYDSNGRLRIHLNMGWSGNGNGWYELPNVVFDYYSFDSVALMIYDIFPGGGGAPGADGIPANAASIYDGYILDSAGAVCGTIQIKAGKPKNDESKLTAKIVQFGNGAKLSLKGTASLTGSGPTTATLSGGGQTISVELAANEMTGDMGSGRSIVGCRNFSSTKGDARMADYNKWAGRTWTLALASEPVAGAGAAFAHGFSGLSIAVAAKGKVTVKGTMADGTKVSVKSQAILASDNSSAVIPVLAQMYAGKTGGWSGIVKLTPTSATAEALTKWDASKNAKAPFTANLAYTAGANAIPPPTKEYSFETKAADYPSIPGMLPQYLPTDMKFGIAGGKAVLPAASKIKPAPGTGDLPDAAGLANASGLKLTFSQKDGSFKGTYSVYTFINSKLKKTKATVTGTMVGSVGFGVATIKGVGSVPVWIK